MAPIASLLQRRQGRYELLTALLDELSLHTLMIAEDVHWADEATLDALRFIGRRITGTRSLVVVTYRDDEVGAGHPLRAVLGDLATTSECERLHVPPLSTAVSTISTASAATPSRGSQRFASSRAPLGRGRPSGGRSAPPPGGPDLIPITALCMQGRVRVRRGDPAGAVARRGMGARSVHRRPAATLADRGGPRGIRLALRPGGDDRGARQADIRPGRRARRPLGDRRARILAFARAGAGSPGRGGGRPVCAPRGAAAARKIGIVATRT